MKTFLISFLIIYSIGAYSEEDNHADHNEKEEPIELTEQAIKNFGINVQKINPINQKADIPRSAVVRSEDKNQIFILHDGKYELREINVLKSTSLVVTVDSFTEPEDVVISGVNYLKVVEMSHGEEGGGGHGH